MQGVERALDWGRQLQDRTHALQEAGHPQHWKQRREQSFAGAVRSLPAQCRALADCLREWEQTLGRDEHKVLASSGAGSCSRRRPRWRAAKWPGCAAASGTWAAPPATGRGRAGRPGGAVQGAGHRDDLGHVFADDEGGHMQQMKGLSALCPTVSHGVPPKIEGQGLQ